MAGVCEADRRWTFNGLWKRGRVRVLRVRWVKCEVVVRRMRWARDLGIILLGVVWMWTLMLVLMVLMAIWR